MKKRQTILIGYLLTLLVAAGATAGVVAPDLQDAARTLAPEAEVPVIIRLNETVDLKSFTDTDRAVRSSKIIKALIDRKDRTQKDLLKFLKDNKVKDPLSLWIINGIAARVPVSLVDELAGLPLVDQVTLDAVVTLPPEPVPAGTDFGTGRPRVEHRRRACSRDVGSRLRRRRERGGCHGLRCRCGPSRHRSQVPRWWQQLVRSHRRHDVPTIPADTAPRSRGSSSAGMPGAPPSAWHPVPSGSRSKSSTIMEIQTSKRIHLGFQWLLDPDGDRHP